MKPKIDDGGSESFEGVWAEEEEMALKCSTWSCELRSQFEAMLKRCLLP